MNEEEKRIENTLENSYYKAKEELDKALKEFIDAISEEYGWVIFKFINKLKKR